MKKAIDQGTRNHLLYCLDTLIRSWIEHHAPVDPGKWDETEEKMLKVIQDDPEYCLNSIWNRVFEHVKFGRYE